MLHRCLCLAFVLASVALPAQTTSPGPEVSRTERVNVPFDAEHFSDAPGLERALQAIKQGDALYAKGGAGFAEALERYNEALAFNPDNADLNVRIGLCHLNGIWPHKALPYFQQALALDPYLPRLHFYLGYSYQLNAQWDEAIAEFQTQRAIVLRTPDPDRTFNMADKHISECRNGKAAMAKPVQATVRNLGPGINSEGPEYGALVTADGSRLMFTSRRNTCTGGRINRMTNEYFEDVFACDRTAEGWSGPAPIAAPVNTPANDASVGLFNDGRTMIIYRDQKGVGDLYETTRTADAWSAPRPFPPTVNSPAHETSAWYSFDRQWLYFTSDREGGLGGSDIYRSPWNAATATWGPAENLGPAVNTPYNEDGVFMAADGRTLYFGSEGHTSMGGYDLFRTVLNADGTWGRPENLGWPINSPGDDQFLVLTADGSTGYFNSTRPDGLGQDDIYQVEMPPVLRVDDTAMLVSASSGVPTTEKSDMNTLLLIGFVKSIKMMEAIEAKIELMDLQDRSVVADFTSDAKTGAFTVVVPGGHDYAMYVSADGFLIHSENVKAVDSTGTRTSMDILMNPCETGSSEVMRNIFFTPNAWELLPPSIADLDKLVEQLNAYPALRLEVSGHTDDGIGPVDNQHLSENRAQAVVDHLVSKGIAPGRLVAKGYGPDRPLAPNDTKEHRALNRRTEIRVL